MGSPLASDPASPEARIFRGSHPPSPSLAPGFINLKITNTRHGQPTASPESPTAEDQRLQVCGLFDQLIELGGVPLRPWIDYRAEDLTDAQRGDDNGEEYITNLYRADSALWQNHLNLWRRFSKRRSQDGEPDLRDLEPAEAVEAFIAYLRGHLQRDMQDRGKPGCEIWSDFPQMMFHSDFIDKILDLLPAVAALGKRLRTEKSGELAPREPEVTSEGPRKEYSIPHRRSWMDSWTHPQESLPPASESEPPHSPKRQRRDRSEADARLQKRQRDDSSKDDARPPKRPASHSKPSSAEPIRSTSGKRPEVQSPAPQQTTDAPTKPGNSKRKRGPTDGHTPQRPPDTRRAKAKAPKTTRAAERGHRPMVVGAGEGSTTTDAPGLRRSARVAAKGLSSKRLG